MKLDLVLISVAATSFALFTDVHADSFTVIIACIKTNSLRTGWRRENGTYAYTASSTTPEVYNALQRRQSRTGKPQRQVS